MSVTLPTPIVLAMLSMAALMPVAVAIYMFAILGRVQSELLRLLSWAAMFMTLVGVLGGQMVLEQRFDAGNQANRDFGLAVWAAESVVALIVMFWGAFRYRRRNTGK